MFMKIIFLDIDGVLNHQSFYKKVSASKRSESRRYLDDEWGEIFCPVSTSLINKLILETGAKVVITSTKRATKYISDYTQNLKCIQDMW